MIPAVEMNPENVSSDSRFVSEDFAAPIAFVFGWFVRSFDVRLKSIGLEEWPGAVAADKPRLWKTKKGIKIK